MKRQVNCPKGLAFTTLEMKEQRWGGEFLRPAVDAGARQRTQIAREEISLAGKGTRVQAEAVEGTPSKNSGGIRDGGRKKGDNGKGGGRVTVILRLYHSET